MNLSYPSDSISPLFKKKKKKKKKKKNLSKGLSTLHKK